MENLSLENLVKIKDDVSEGIKSLVEQNFVKRIWDQDPSLWTSNLKHQKAIQSRLGWLTVIQEIKDQIHEIEHTVSHFSQKGFKNVILLGMGGSSLCAEVLAKLYPEKPLMRVQILDSTDPKIISSIQKQVSLDHTVFIVASKSGTTIEVQALYNYFQSLIPKSDQFIAITDPDTPLHHLAQSKGFFKTFLNPQDIGGRYSALSYFGLVPAAFLGTNLDRLLQQASQMQEKCKNNEDSNPGVILGAILGIACRLGRDKLTFLTSSPLSPVFDWIEQLVAESTGKDGKGILPVMEERPSASTLDSKDRLFVHLNLQESPSPQAFPFFQKAGQPFTHLTISNFYSLGAEFFRWEFATATAGMILQVNPFDEPNVKRTKEITKELLINWNHSGNESKPEYKPANPQTILSFLQDIKEPSFLALLAYLPSSNEIRSELFKLRDILSNRFGVATTVGFGPRFLHSTGQYHKGGPNQGRFIQFVCKDEKLAIPGFSYDFSALKAAQASADLKALQETGRRVLGLDLEDQPLEKLKKLQSEIST